MTCLKNANVSKCRCHVKYSDVINVDVISEKQLCHKRRCHV
jgi:hypothetical protein